VLMIKVLQDPSKGDIERSSVLRVMRGRQNPSRRPTHIGPTI
jgi:hypothetical protein